jgi:UDP-glucose 4-epimerase
VKVLVTGASGFIGSYVVAEFLRRGHAVRALALARSSPAAGDFPWSEQVEFFPADLRRSERLGEAVEGVDAVVHLAARLGGNEVQQFQTTVVGTERLLEAVEATGPARVVLASSYAVYDWEAVSGTITESSPVSHDDYRRGPYTIAKVWQERVARRMAEAAGFSLTVLRPGFVWGPRHTWLPGMGQRLGPVYIVFGRSTLLPLTYVENCADAFVEATVNRNARDETLNVVDGEQITAWRYTREYLERTRSGATCVAVPYAVGWRVSQLADAIARRVFDAGGNLPDVLVPSRFAAQYKPLEFPNDKIRELLGWKPRLTFEEALERAYAEPAVPPPRRPGSG